MIDPISTLAIPAQKRLIDNYSVQRDETVCPMLVEVSDETINQHPSISFE
jgi:hypothetical protein